MSNHAARRTAVVRNPQGLHARPAHLLTREAARFAARIEIIKDRERVDGKSILSLLTLAATQGSELTIEAFGPDAEAAVAALAELVERGFDEDAAVASRESPSPTAAAPGPAAE